MDRKEFFKKIGLGVAVAAITPKILIPESTGNYLGDFKEIVRTSNRTSKWTNNEYDFYPHSAKLNYKMSGGKTTAVAYISPNDFGIGDIILVEETLQCGIVASIEISFITLSFLKGVSSKDINFRGAHKGTYLRKLGGKINA